MAQTISKEAAMKALFSNRLTTISTLLDIDDKSRQKVPLLPNPIQRDVILSSSMRDIYVKPAQVGFTSIVVGDFYLDNITINGTVSVIISYDEFSAQRQILKAKRYHQSLQHKIPTIPRLEHKSATELSWMNKDTNFYSTMYIFSARSYMLGRGEVIHNLLLDEYAFWPEGTHEMVMSSALQRVPLTANTKVRIGCYDKNTELLTKGGWVAFPDLREDMEIFTKNPFTNRAYYTKPQAVLEYPYNGKMFHLKGKRLDLLVTPDHDLWVKSRASGHGSNYKFRKAPELAKSGALFDTSVNWEGVEEDYFALPALGSKPEVRIPMYLWAEYLGYFLSEGYTDAGCGTWLCQNGNSEHWFDMINASEKLAMVLGAEQYESARKGRELLEWCIRDSRLHSYLSSYTMPKRLPDNMRFVKCEYMQVLIDAFSKGDGSSSRNCLFNTSLPLMNSLQEVLLKLGYSTNLYPRSSTVGRRKVEYMLSWSAESNVSFRHKLPEEVDYSGTVYCATVPHHLLLVRRNGKAVWCGNSTANGEDNPFCEVYRAAKEGTALGGSVYKYHFYPWFMHPEYVMYATDPFCMQGDDTDPLPNLQPDEIRLMRLLVEVYGDDELTAMARLRWRRYKIAEVASLRRSGETMFIFSQEFPEDDETCFMTAGDQAYDADIISSKIRDCYPAPIHRTVMNLKNGTSAGVDVWYDREKGRSYILSIDPGKGKTSESVGQVWTFDEGYTRPDGTEVPPSMVHCATIAGFYDEWEMAQYCMDLARYYENTVIAPEDNLDIVSHLREWPNLYMREDPRTGRGIRAIGWQTNLSTKPYMITELNRNMDYITCHDIRFWSQCRNIRRNASVKSGIIVVGADDHHDCGAIAIVCRSAQAVQVGYVGSAGWPDDWGK